MPNMNTSWEFSLQTGTEFDDSVRFVTVNLELFRESLRAKLLRIKQAEESVVSFAQSQSTSIESQGSNLFAFAMMAIEIIEPVLGDLHDCLEFLGSRLLTCRMLNHSTEDSVIEVLYHLHLHLSAVLELYSIPKNFLQLKERV